MLPRPFFVPCEPAPVTAILYPASAVPSRATVVLAHGAGAGQRHPFIVSFARSLAELGLNAVTFNFPYMERGRKIPDRAPVLEACFRSVIDAARRELPDRWRPFFIGGKSMGGRMATHVAASNGSLAVDGLVLLGYPLHPPGQPEKRRDAHLSRVGRPALFVQGSRDAFGTPEELRPALELMSPVPTLHVVPGGDHSFKVTGGGTAGQARIEAGLQQLVADWMQSVAG